MDYKLSKHVIDVISNRNIKTKWIKYTLNNPSLINEISSIESHYFSMIEENEFRCLKVVFNPYKKIIITAYFDRNMRKKGCK